MISRSLSGLVFLGSACLPLLAVASSHREAPLSFQLRFAGSIACSEILAT